jgi:hypothetical protein
MTYVVVLYISSSAESKSETENKTPKPIFNNTTPSHQKKLQKGTKT